MKTLHRQRNRYWFRLITIIVITTFLSQNIGWSAPALHKETLAPNSEFARLASRIDLEMAGIGHCFIQWIKAVNIHTLPQLEALITRNPKIREDLFRININTIFYPDKIELISPHFTLAFLDADEFPNDGFYQLPGTNIRIDLYKRPLPPAPAQPKSSIKSPERAVITDREITGINTIPIPKKQRVLVIEIEHNDHLPYAGNFVKRLQEQNEVQIYTLENLKNLKETILDFKPQIILFPDNQPDIYGLIKYSPFEHIFLCYESLRAGFAENAYFPISPKDVPVGKESITKYESQVERTPYHEIAELFAEYTGSKSGNAYAHPFVVTSIENGQLKTPDMSQQQEIDIDNNLPLISASPHMDDMPIATFGLCRAKLRDTTPGKTGLVDLVFTYSERAVLGPGTIEEKRRRRIEEDTAAKRTLEQEVGGNIETEYFGFDLKNANLYEQQLKRVIDFFNIFCNKYEDKITNGITVTLPHPKDNHPTHRRTTEITINALKIISKEKGLRVNVLFYKSPWSDNHNTFYVSKEDVAHDKVAGLGKQVNIRTVGELAAGDFAGRSPTPEELGGEFTERFRRENHVPRKYIEDIDLEKLDAAMHKDRMVQSHSGIRMSYGTEKETLTDEEKIIAFIYAYNYLKFMFENIKESQGDSLPEKLQFVIGHDTRPTAGALLETQIRGFYAAALSLGIELEITNLGMIPKPIYQNAVRKFQANGGVYLTASHNEFSFNGLQYSTKYKKEKGFTFGGSLLNAEESAKLISGFAKTIGRLQAEDPSMIEAANGTWPVIKFDEDEYKRAIREYKKFVFEKFGAVPDVKIVLNPNGGTGSHIYKEILEELGITVVEINAIPGSPGHAIDPEKDLQCFNRLAKIVKESGALFGITFDCDADRAYITIPDEGGNPKETPPQDTSAKNVNTVLKWCETNGKLTGKTAIVANGPTSRRIEHIAENFGARIFRVEVGETNLVNKMHLLRQEGWYVPIGIEGSNGGTIFFDSMCRDGLLSTISLALLETARVPEVPIPQYYTEIYAIDDVEIPIMDLKLRLEEYIEKNPPEGVIDYELHYFEGTEHIINRSKIHGQGIRDATGGWKLVLKTDNGKEHFIWLRPSKTEPNKIRVEFDSPDKDMFYKLKRFFHFAVLDQRCRISEDYEEMSRKAAEYFVKEVKRQIEEKGRAVVCFASDRTSKKMYEIISSEEFINKIDWSKVITFNLDEYVFPNAPDADDIRKNPISLRYNMEKKLFKKLRDNERLKREGRALPEENINFLDGNEKDIDGEIERYKKAIKDAGGFDLCILGIGRNAHLAFCEPGRPFDSEVYKETLSETTKTANFDEVTKDTPSEALTVGLQDIMNSRKIMLLASSSKKQDAVCKAILGPVTKQVPASILQRHSDVRYFINKNAYGGIYRQKFKDAFSRLREIPAEKFIPEPLERELRTQSPGQDIIFKDCDSLEELETFCRETVLDPDKIVVIKLINSRGNVPIEEIHIFAINFKGLKEKVLGEDSSKTAVFSWDKTYLYRSASFDLEACEIVSPGLYIDPKTFKHDEGFGRALFLLFARHLIETGFGGYPYKTPVENPRTASLIYSHLNGRIYTGNRLHEASIAKLLYQLFVMHLSGAEVTEIVSKLEEFKNDPDGKARELLGFLIEKTREGVDIDWKKIYLPLIGTIPNSVEELYSPRTKKQGPLAPLTKSLRTILGVYSNVHRGTGQHSYASTLAYEHAREIVGNHFGRDPKEHTVIFGTNKYQAILQQCCDIKLSADKRGLNGTTVISNIRFGSFDFNDLLEEFKPDKIITPETLSRLPDLLSKNKVSLVALSSDSFSSIEELRKISEAIHEAGAKLLIETRGNELDKEINMKDLNIDFLVTASSNYGFPLECSAMISRLSLLPTHYSEVPYYTGGGVALMATRDDIIHANYPEKGEAGTPNITGAVLLAKILQDGIKLGEGLNEIDHKELFAVSDDLTIEKLKELLIGKDSVVPMRDGEAVYTNLDNGASTPSFELIMESIEKALSLNKESQLEAYEEARRIVEDFFGVDPDKHKVIFTRNTTEAINLLAHNIELSPDAIVVNTESEHNSNELPWRKFKNHIRLGVDNDGFIDIGELRAEFKKHNTPGSTQRIELVAISGASNVLGTLNKITAIAELAHSYGAKILVDGAQLSAHRPVCMKEMGIDYLAVSGHKIYAPFGCSALITLKDNPKNLKEKGEPNILGAVALAKSLSVLKKIGMKEVKEDEEKLTEYALEQMKGIKGIDIYGIQPGSGTEDKSGVVSFNIKTLETDIELPERFTEFIVKEKWFPHGLLAQILAEEGAIGARNACFCAHILLQDVLACPLPKLLEQKQRAQEGKSLIPGSVRISFGIYNTKEDVDRVVAILKKLVTGGYNKLLEQYEMDESGGYFTPPYRDKLETFGRKKLAEIYGDGEETAPKLTPVKQQFSRAYRKICSLSPKDFIPKELQDELYEKNDKRKVIYYKFKSIEEMFGYFKDKTIKSDEIIVVELIHNNQVLITAMRFKDFKHAVLDNKRIECGEEDINLWDSEIFLLIQREFDMRQYSVLGRGIKLRRDLRTNGFGKQLFFKFVQRLAECGFEGYLYESEIANPKTLCFYANYLNGRINTENWGLTQKMIDKLIDLAREHDLDRLLEHTLTFKEDRKAHAREFFKFLAEYDIYSRFDETGSKYIRIPAVCTIPVKVELSESVTDNGITVTPAADSKTALISSTIAEELARSLGTSLEGRHPAEVIPDVRRAGIKQQIRELLIQRQEYRTDGEFRKEFETKTEALTHRLHELVTHEEACRAGKSLFDFIQKAPSASLSQFHGHLREISGLDLLDAIEKCFMGPTEQHVAMMPKAIESLMKGDRDFFTDRVTNPDDRTDELLGKMENILFEVAEDKEIFAAFIIASLLHDYGLLLMRAGVNSHAEDGEKLLESFLNQFNFSPRIKRIVLALVSEHAKFPMMFQGCVTPYNYEQSLGRLEDEGIPREQALQMYSLLLFLDSCSADSGWLREEAWLNNKYLQGMLFFSKEYFFDQLKQNYYKRRFLMFAGNELAFLGGRNAADGSFRDQLRGEAADVFAEVADDPDFERYTDRLRINPTQKTTERVDGTHFLKALTTKEEGIDNPSIIKLFCLLSYLYSSNRWDPEEIEVLLDGDLGSVEYVDEAFGGLSITAIKDACIGCNGNMQQLCSALNLNFKIEKTDKSLVVNLRHRETPADVTVHLHPMDFWISIFATILIAFHLFLYYNVLINLIFIPLATIILAEFSRICHEAGHYTSARLLGAKKVKWRKGSMTTYDITDLSRAKRIIITASGPLMNLFLAAISILPIIFFPDYTLKFLLILLFNVIAGGLSLLPLPGRDGEKIFNELSRTLRPVEIPQWHPERDGFSSHNLTVLVRISKKAGVPYEELRKSLELAMAYGVYKEHYVDHMLSWLGENAIKGNIEYHDSLPPRWKKGIILVWNFLMIMGLNPEKIERIIPGSKSEIESAWKGEFATSEGKGFGEEISLGYYFPNDLLYSNNDNFYNLLEFEDGDTYLDLFGGTGTEAINVARRIQREKKNVFVYMLDANARNIYRAMRFAELAGVGPDRIGFIMRDARANTQGIPLQNNSVTKVTILLDSFLGAEEEDVEEVFKEILRVSADGTRIFYDGSDEYIHDGFLEKVAEKGGRDIDVKYKYVSAEEAPVLRSGILLDIRVNHAKTFSKKVDSTLTGLTETGRLEQAKQHAAPPLGREVQARKDKLTQAMAWHVLEGIAEYKNFKGKIIYSCNKALQSRLNGEDRDRLKRLVTRTRGKVFFYAGENYMLDPDYDYFKDSMVVKRGNTLVNKNSEEAIVDLNKKDELTVFMISDEHRKHLGTGKFSAGRVKRGKFLVPLTGRRTVENDLFLGLEILRNNGKIDNLHSLFQLLLVDSIRDWLEANGKKPSRKRVQRILKIKIPVRYLDHRRDIERSHRHIEDLISSA